MILANAVLRCLIPKAFSLFMMLAPSLDLFLLHFQALFPSTHHLMTLPPPPLHLLLSLSTILSLLHLLFLLVKKLICKCLWNGMAARNLMTMSMMCSLLHLGARQEGMIHGMIFMSAINLFISYNNVFAYCITV